MTAGAHRSRPGRARRSAASRSASFCVPIIVFVGWRLAQPGQGLGLLGGGYGAVQVAITRRQLVAARLDAAPRCCCFSASRRSSPSSLTIGTGGSAGDFAPVAGHRRPLRRRLRPRRAAAAARSAHRSGRLRAGRDGDLLRRHRAHAAVVAGPGLRAGRQLRPARAAHAGRGDRLRRAAQAVALPRPRSRPSANRPPTSTPRSTADDDARSARSCG